MDVDDTNPAPQNDALELISRQADELETTGQAQAAAGGQTTAVATKKEPELTNEQAVAMLLTMAREGAVSLLNSQTIVVTLADEKIEKASKAIAPVMDKYGLRMGGIAAGPEVTAIVVAGPVMWAAYASLMFELNERKRAVLEARQNMATVTPPANVVPMSVVAGEHG